MKMKNVADVYKLSPIQAGLLFHSIRDPESGVYFGQYTCTFEGMLEITNFQKAWQQVVERHTALRTVFLWEGLKEPLQVVRQQVELPWQILDWQTLTTAEQQTALENYLQTDRKQGFDLAQAPLLRFALMRLAPNRTQFVWSTHHLLLDGWSTALVIKEVLTIYDGLQRKISLTLKPPKPYRDYIAWLQQQSLSEAEVFWRKMLADFTEPTVLPIQSHVAQTSAYTRKQFTLTTETTLQSLARNNRLTTNTLIQGAWSILLSRYSRQQDVVFGVTMAGRPTDLVDADKRVGLFINTLPARVKLSPENSLESLLKAIQKQQIEVRQYEYSPLIKVQQWSGIPAGQSLFETIVVFENYPALTTTNSSLVVQNIRYTEQSNYPLSLLVVPEHQNLRFILVYDRAIYSDTVIERLLSHLQTILINMTAGLEQSVGQLDILTQQEREQQLVDWNKTRTDYPNNRCIHHLIETQTQTIAVATADGQTLTYAALQQRANQLAHYLQQQGVKPSMLVGLCVERSLEMIIGILGILKAGGAYVPLDPTYPKARLALMITEFANEQTILLTQTKLLSHLPEHQAQIICLDNSDMSQLPTTAPENQTTADDLAYMIYTSGSTGKPKGVLVTHRNLVHATTAREHYYPETFSAFLLLSSFAFDSSMVGLFWSLYQGKTLILPQPDQEKDIEALANLIEKYQVSHTLCVPSLYQLLLTYADPTQLRSLVNVIVAGEACPSDLVEQHFQQLPRTALYNEYGPTEATVWSTVSQLLPSQPITIGQPIANTQIYILDEQQNPVPIGVPGEIYISGEGIAQGYYNQPKITAQCFVPNPFKPNARCYRTGDLARYRSDGHIEFLGRIDQQIKIHGYRIELGEIEAVLNQHPDVQEALVTAHNEQLVAYVKTTQSVSSPEWQTLLAQQLPDYMRPTQVIALEQFPLLPNGKIDRQALPEPTQEISSTDFIAPRNELEQTLADIWAEVLNLDRVSIEDHFLQIGGDSISSIQVVAKARQAGLFFTPKDLFERPQIATLAEIIQIHASAQQQTLIVGEIPLTPIQHWFFEQIKPVPQHWNQAIQLAIPKTVTPTMLHKALQYLCQHHDALRMRFVHSAQGWQQFNQGKDYQVPWQVIDLPLSQQEVAIEQQANQLQSQLDFATSLLQTALFQLGTENRLLIIVHHLIIDHVSWQILLEDLDQLCQQQMSHQSMQLPEKTLAFQDWARQLADDAQSTETAQQLSQWLDFLQQPSTNIPIDFPDRRAENIEATHCIYSTSLNQAQTQALLQEVPKAYQTQINDVLLTALLQTLYTWTGDSSWLFDLESHGRQRDDLDVSRTIGWFTSYFPVVLQMHETESGALLKSVKEQLRQIPQKGLSYGLLRYLSAEPKIKQKLTQLPQADILFDYLGQRQPSARICKIITEANNGLSRSPRNQRRYLLEINACIIEGKLQTNWSYSQALYRQTTIEYLAQSFMTALQALIEHCQLPGVGGFTPSDFAESGLNQTQLDQFIDKITANG
jgi:amino acid adenylation domain-containing protein/non-ribosomal peptide synthase protein (TIGR01720 family)